MKAKVIDKSLEDDTKIYKHMEFKNFKILLDSSSLYLPSVKKWEDPFEMLGEITITNMNNKLSVNRNVHGQCWTLKEESDAMWRIYCLNNGVKIQTSIAKLASLNYQEHTEICKIEYHKIKRNKDSNKKLIINNTLNTEFGFTFVKREPFSHEEEVRVATKGKDKEFTLVDINVNDFIEEVVITPWASDWYEKRIRNLCKKYKLKCRKSELYGDLNFKLGDIIFV